ncbi:flavin reductase family protein [Curvibacter gracilis]|uniref:flavin reductase family protein n=1 Tax=Curvibacter gracilis TaxID=230310 RepID=UPI00048317D9|nr:flavin reductase family protein [Curvibacter gracilis]
MTRLAVDLAKATRLLNHGPTVLVSSAHAGRHNVMAAAWSMPLDFEPPKVAVVIDKATLTRELVDASGEFVLNIPPAAMAQATLRLGRESGRDQPDKLARSGIRLEPASRVQAPLVQGCIAWLECRVLPTSAAVAGPHDLFLAEVLAAWADERVFRDGHWRFEEAPDELRSLHYVAGGHFYQIGSSIDVES